jgi:hypothetical protein
LDSACNTSAAERRAALHELRARARKAEEQAGEIGREEVLAEVAELRAQSLDEQATAHDQRAKSLQAKTAFERRAALERAAAAEERAEAY